MSIVSNYIWEKGLDGGRNPVSLIAQQAGLKGREICLFCVCESPQGEWGGRVTEQLVDWFHKICLPACGGRRQPVLEELLEEELYEIERELPGKDRGSYGGLLLMGNRFYLFGRGNIEVRLVNCRYNRPQMKELGFPLSGRIQRGAGLLLHTPLLTEKLEQEEVCQILHGEGRWQEERIARRLKELWQEGRSRGNTGPVGGIYLQVV